MKTVLWISRHPMTGAQRDDLARVMGDAVRLVEWKETVEDLDALRPEIARADAVAAVLPTELLARLLDLAGDCPVLLSEARRTLTGRMTTRPDGLPEPETAFGHVGWKRLVELRVITEPL